MDEISNMYVGMASGVQSRLHDPTASFQFVERLKAMLDQSTAPRKNFLIDSTTPHGDVVITESSAMKPGIGWITLQVTECLRRGVHEWGVKIDNQGETSDGSGLMLGIVPKNFSKFDSFISQGGGWCLSRAGKFYGHWRRVDNGANSDSLGFGTGDRVIFRLDYEASRMTVRVGDKSVIGEISNLNTEVFPAISLHYRRQRVSFDYHIVHDRNSKVLNWIDRQVFPQAAAFLPFTLSQLEKIKLDTYLCSSIFADEEEDPNAPTSRHLIEGERSNKSTKLISAGSIIKYNRYASLEAAKAREVILSKVFVSLSQCLENGDFSRILLPLEVTAEYLRRRNFEASLLQNGSGCFLQGSISSSSLTSTYSLPRDATVSGGMALAIHLFTHAVRNTRNPEIALPLVKSLTKYLCDLPPCSLAETTPLGLHASSDMSPEIVQLAVDSIHSLLEPFLKKEGAKLDELGTSLMELSVLMGFHQGNVGELLRVSRSLSLVASHSCSHELFQWLCEYQDEIVPPKLIPDLAKTVKFPTLRDPSNTFALAMNMEQVLSICYAQRGLYSHHKNGLYFWIPGSFDPHVTSSEPTSVCVAANSSSLASVSSQVILITDLMLKEGVAAVIYKAFTLEVAHIINLKEAPSFWPTEFTPLIGSGAGGKIVLLCRKEKSFQSVTQLLESDSMQKKNEEGALAALLFPTISSFPAQPSSVILLKAFRPQIPFFSTALCLRKRGLINFGSPDNSLCSANGYVTVELWVLLFDSNSCGTLYQHGDKSSGGEVFLETTIIDDVFSFRGGYRHEKRGICAVSYPVPPSSTRQFLHVAIVFDCKWRLFIEGVEVVGNKQGPHISVNAPKYYWRLGDLPCMLGALRVWNTSRKPLDIRRDFVRPLFGTEPGLVLQCFFNEQSGNVVYNYTKNDSSDEFDGHGVLSGSYERRSCTIHPFRGGRSSIGEFSIPALWNSAQVSQLIVDGGRIGLVTTREGSGKINDHPAGLLLSYFSLSTGEAYKDAYYLPSSNGQPSFIGCNSDGVTLQLMEVTKEEKEEYELPLELKHIAIVLALPSARESLWLTEVPPLLPEQEAETSSSNVPLSYGELGIWISKVLSSRSEVSFENAMSTAAAIPLLYAPLTDDISSRCFNEILENLCLYLRVVRATNSRRAVALKDPEASASYVTASLKILRRLILGVSALNIDPETIGLSVPRGEILGTIARCKALAGWKAPPVNSSATRSDFNASQSQDDVPRFSLCTTLIGILADIINEAGVSLPVELGSLAQETLINGIELFFPSAVVRAELILSLLDLDGKYLIIDEGRIFFKTLLVSLVKSIGNTQCALTIIVEPTDPDRTLLLLGALLQEIVLLLKHAQSTPSTPSTNCDTSTSSFLSLDPFVDTISILQMALIAAGTENDPHTIKNGRKMLKDYYELLFGIIDEVFRIIGQLLEDESSSESIISNFRESPLWIPVHTALSALPSVVTTDEAQWYLQHVHALLQLEETIDISGGGQTECDGNAPHKRKSESYAVEKPERVCSVSSSYTGGGTHPAGAAIRPALLYVFSWIAAFLSRSNLLLPLAMAEVSKSSEKSLLIDHPLLSGGTIHLPNQSNEVSSIAGSSPRRKFLTTMKAKSADWKETFRVLDPVMAKAPGELLDFAIQACLTVLYLSNTPSKILSEEKSCVSLAKDTLRRLIPLLKRVLEVSRGKPTGFLAELIRDLNQRTLVLLDFQNQMELSPDLSLLILASQTEALRKMGKSSPKERWRWLFAHIKLAKIFHRAILFSNPSLNLSAAIAFVSEVCNPESNMTANQWQEHVCDREKSGMLCLDGLQKLSSVLQKVPASSYSIAFLLNDKERYQGGHYDSFFNGCSSFVANQVRQKFYDLLVWYVQHEKMHQQVNLRIQHKDLNPNGDKETYQEEQSVLAQFLQQDWLAKDFLLFYHLNIVPLIFDAYGSIFSVGGSDLREETTAERAHREAARAQCPLKQSSEDPLLEKKDEPCYRRTDKETVTYHSLLCCKHLSIRCARFLSTDSNPVDIKAASIFLQGYFATLERELTKCEDHFRQNSSSSQNIVKDQVSLICSLISAVIRSIQPHFTFSHEGLAHTASKLAWRLTSITNALSALLPYSLSTCEAGIANSGLLILHCSPSQTNDVFYPHALAETVHSTISTHFITFENAVFEYFFAMAITNLKRNALDSISRRILLTLHTLFHSPRWQPHLLLHVNRNFSIDLKSFASGEDRTDMRYLSEIHVFSWTVILSGALWVPPAQGLLMKRNPERECVSEKELVYVVEMSSSDDSAAVVPLSGKVGKDGSAFFAYQEEIINVEMEKIDTPDNLLLAYMAPNFTDSRSTSAFVELFVVAAIVLFLGEKSEVDLSVVMRACVASILQLVVSLCRDSVEACHILIKRGAMALVSRYASKVLLRSSLPILYLHEACAYALSISFKASILAPTLAGVEAPGAIRAPAFDSPPINIHNVTNFPSLATVHLGSGSPPSSPEAMSFMPTNMPTVANSLGISLSDPPQATRDDELLPPSVVLCIPLTSSTPLRASGAVVIEDARHRTASNAFPAWEDGIAIEVALMLFDRLLPSLGEAYSVPSSWNRPEIYFDLITFPSSSNIGGNDQPLIQIKIQPNDIQCTIKSLHSHDCSVVCRVPLHDDDWDQWISLSLVITGKSACLRKNSTMDAKSIPQGTWSSLESLFKQQGKVPSVILGTIPDSGKEFGISSPLVFLSGLRMSGVRSLHEKEALPMKDSMLWARASCQFSFLDSTGDCTYSSDGIYKGRFLGNVRWSSYPTVQGGNVYLSIFEKLNTGNDPTLEFMVPRKELRSFISSLDSASLEKWSKDVWYTLCGHLSRSATREACLSCISPSYSLYMDSQKQEESKRRLSGHLPGLGPYAHSGLSSILQKPVAIHLMNTFRFSDARSLSESAREEVEKIIRHFVARELPDDASMVDFFRDTFNSLTSVLNEHKEVVEVSVPSFSCASKDSPVMPLTFINGGDAIISFDGKARDLEHVAIYKDKQEKIQFTKYPDEHGQWPDRHLEADTPWHYVSFRRTGNNSASRVPNSTFTLLLYSLKPVVASYILTTVAQILLEEPLSGLRILRCAAPFALNAKIFRILSNIGTTGKMSSRFHALRVLSSLFNLWQRFPEVQPHDRLPLNVLLGDLNASVLAFLNRETENKITKPMLSAFGTYNAYLQCAVGILVAGLKLQCAWERVSLRMKLRFQYQRILRIWRQSFVSVKGKQLSPLEDTTPHVSLELFPCSATTMGPTATTGHKIMQLGSGEWRVYRLDSGSNSTVSVRASVGITKGRYYFEVHMLDDESTLSLGVVTESVENVDNVNPLGCDGESWAFDSGRQSHVHHGVRQEFTVRGKWTRSDYIGVIIDLESDRLSCLVNGRQISSFDHFVDTSYETINTNKKRAFFPAISCNGRGFYANFGAAPFNNDIPHGCLPIDPIHYGTAPFRLLWFLVSTSEWAERANQAYLQQALDKTEILADPLLMYMTEKVRQYCSGRTGPLSVGLLSSNPRDIRGIIDAHALDNPTIVRGTVSVTEGRWYFEVVIVSENVSIGWVTSNFAIDAHQRGTFNLGETPESWIVDGKRMVAKHDSRHSSLRQYWDVHDTVGCLLDCENGTISFTVNGIPLRDVKDLSEDGVLFRNVDASAGLVPVALLEPEAEARFYFDKDNFARPPENCKALGAKDLISECLIEHFLLGKDLSTLGVSPSSFTYAQAEKTVRFLTNSLELSLLNIKPHCISAKLLPPDPATDASDANLALQCREQKLAALLCLSYAVECMSPYGLSCVVPEDTQGSWGTDFSSLLHRSIRVLRPYYLPYIGLQLAHSILSSAKSTPSNLKLTLNRRRALALSAEKDLSVEEKLNRSIFGQVFQLLRNKPLNIYRSGRKMWSVTFFGEGADDVGGPYRECLCQMCSELMSSDLPLFIESPNQANDLGENRDTFVINPELDSPIDLSMYHFVGKLMAGCLKSGEPLPLYLPSYIWKSLVGEPMTIEDLKQTDQATTQALEYFTHSAKMSDEEFAALCPGTFTIQNDAGVQCPLVEKGDTYPVTRDNIQLFTRLVLEYKLKHAASRQLKALQESFFSIIPIAHVGCMRWYELEALLCGLRDYDSDAFLATARYDTLKQDDPRAEFLRIILREFTRRQRALFMRFVSGRERLPTGVRLRLLSDDSGRGAAANDSNTRKGLAPSSTDDNRLPHASTCFYWLSLPHYSSLEVMRNRLIFAIEQCVDIDADFRVTDHMGSEEEEPTLAVAVNDDDDDEFEDFSHLR